MVDGALIADDTRDINITANSIHVRAGKILAGNSTKPFEHKFTIQVNGNKADNGFYIDPIVAGNKYFVVTGSLELFGVAPATTITYLTETALKGSTSIKVSAQSGWKVGDTIVLSPSFSTFN